MKVIADSWGIALVFSSMADLEGTIDNLRGLHHHKQRRLPPHVYLVSETSTPQAVMRDVVNQIYDDAQIVAAAEDTVRKILDRPAPATEVDKQLLGRLVAAVIAKHPDGLPRNEQPSGRQGSQCGT